jgi:hypothetical protein
VIVVLSRSIDYRALSWVDCVRVGVRAQDGALAGVNENQSMGYRCRHGEPADCKSLAKQPA